MAVLGRDIGKRLCEAWHLDPAKVARIEIVIGVADFAKAKVTMLIDGEMVEELFELRPVGDV